MLRLGQTIRFTRSELAELEMYTKADPSGIRTIEDLERYFAAAKQRFAGYPSSAELHRVYDARIAQFKQAGR